MDLVFFEIEFINKFPNTFEHKIGVTEYIQWFFLWYSVTLNIAYIISVCLFHKWTKNEFHQEHKENI